MPSEVWGRDPDEAYKNPYEYGIQEQFVREATVVLRGCYELLASDEHRYTRSDTSLAKAVWLLHMDALDALRDALDALERKRHRIASRLFRDIMETLDLAAHFKEQSADSASDLQKWYANEIVLNGRYREHLKKTDRKGIAEGKKVLHRTLSQFVHRSYHAILEGYSLGEGDRLVHGGSGETVSDHETASTLLVSREAIAAHLAFLAKLVMHFLGEMSDQGTARSAAVQAVFEASMEKEPAKRRYRRQ